MADWRGMNVIMGCIPSANIHKGCSHSPSLLGTAERRVQIAVWFLGQDQPAYFPVPREGGWKFDTQHRQLIIGTGMGRKHIPLDNVAYYSPEEY